MRHMCSLCRASGWSCSTCLAKLRDRRRNVHRSFEFECAYCGVVYVKLQSFAVHVLSTWYSRGCACASMWFWQQVCAAFLGCSQDEVLQGDLDLSMQLEMKKICAATAGDIASGSLACMDKEPAPLAVVQKLYNGGRTARGPGIPCAADHVVHLNRYNHE